MQSTTSDTTLEVGILGTGAMAEALGRAWAAAGHRITIGGRSGEHAEALARRIGGRAAAATSLREAATDRDAVLLAVSWDGVAEALRSAGASDGALADTPLIDCTNAVEHGVGVLLPGIDDSAALQVSALTPGALVVKAFNVFPAHQWQTQAEGDGDDRPIVALAGDDPAALELVGRLVRDVGAVPAVLGPLRRARQIEEVAGFVIGLAFGGRDPARPSRASRDVRADRRPRRE